jgi:FtsZ-binding cell division protein ZapB
VPKSVEERAKEVLSEVRDAPEEGQKNVKVQSVDVVDETPVEQQLATKYAEWTSEQLERARSENRSVEAKLVEELEHADNALLEAVIEDEESLAALSEVDEGAFAPTPRYDEARRRTENLFLRLWAVRKSIAELTLVQDIRHEVKLFEEREKLAKKLPDLEKKVRQAQDELQNLQWQVQDIKQERQQLTMNWANRIAAYEEQRKGPKLQELRRVLGS